MSEILRIAAVGDLMLGEYHLSLGKGVVSRLIAKDIDPFYYVKENLRTYNLVLGNLECIISSRSNKEGIEKYPMRSPPNVVYFLKSAGFGCVSVANNHIMDHGRRAFLETCKNLKSVGIAYCGTHKDPIILDVQTVEDQTKRFGIFGVSFRPNETEFEPLYNIVQNDKELELFCEKILDANNLVDYVIVQSHWGDEFVNIPSPRQIRIAKKLVKNGAHIIIGHHPHVYQGYYRCSASQVFFSLGNFVSDMPSLKTDTGIGATVVMKLSKTEPIETNVIPTIIDRQFMPHFVDTPELRAILSNIDKEIRTYYRTEQQGNYAKIAGKARLRYRIHLWKEFLFSMNELPTIKLEIFLKRIKTALGNIIH